MSSAWSRSSFPERLRDALALSLVEGVGPVRHCELVERAGSATAALGALRRAERDALREEATRLLVRGADAGLRALATGDESYPAALRELPDPPPVLWLRGAGEALALPQAAVVGTRRATAYGLRITRELTRALTRAGVCVVSGMARGIDGEAHRAALDAGGRTIAVLGTGADVAYPPQHRALHTRIASEGLIVSEFAPGSLPNPGAFPRRNRIIAALAQVVIVVEAGAASGALITAQHALDLGRTVAAVPGPIDIPQAAGSNELLRDGAQCIASVADLLALVGRTPPPRSRAPAGDADAEAAWQALADGPADLDTLTTRAGLPAARCLAAVTRLELSGAVECELTGLVRRR